MSIMVIHSLKNAEEGNRKRLLEILQMRTKDQNLIKEAIDLIKKTDSFEYARNVANKLIEDAWKDINTELPNNQGKKKLNLLAQFCISRNI